jgi:subtilase family serine protease
LALVEVLSGLTLLLAAVPAAGQGLVGQAAVGFLPGSPGQERVILRGNVHPAVRDLMPEGRTDGSLPMERMILNFHMRPEAKAQLEHLLVDLQDPGSPSYHQWLTPEQVAARFGPSQAEVAKVSGWLRSQGFTIDEVARGGMTLHFSGDVGTVEQAFRTPIMDYQLQGRKVHANAADPSIPAELAQVVEGVVSLHNIPRKPAHTRARVLPSAEPAWSAGSTPQYNYGGGHYLGPGDFAVIYDVNPLYAASIDGSGVSIAVVERTRSSTGPTNWQAFRSQVGLPANPPTVLINGTDPGDVNPDDDTEADLDTEWAGAVATNAKVLYVCSASTNATDGIDASASYIVNNNLAAIMSTSYSSCEVDMGAGENTFYNQLWKQAALQGISSFVASGDSGAAACDDATNTSGTVQAVSGMASTPYNIAVGGTQFNDSSAYWSNPGTNSPFLSSTTAKSYIPEMAWNESSATGPDAGLWSTGGGASTVYAKPSWQVALGVPAADHRYVPDVALAAAGQNGYLVYTTIDAVSGFNAVGGTSAATPSFAGLMALIVQQTGQRQGNANPTLYQLGNSQYSGMGAAGFHDIQTGNNSVPGVTGFSAGPGYDEATGLGSVDAFELVNNWAASISLPVNSVGILTGRPSVFTATVTNPFGTGVSWSTTAGATIVPGSPSTSATFTASEAGTYVITAAPSGALSRTATITVEVHDANLLGSGQTVTGLDVLDLLGHFGSSGAAFDLNGDGVVDQTDLTLLVSLLGWN